MNNEIITTDASQPENIKPIIPEKEFDIDAFIAKRREFIEKVNKIMVEGKDYHVIQGKKSMAKGGAEKIASIFSWTAFFTKDNDAVEAFTDLQGIIAFVCNLEKNGQPVGQGRGAALLGKNGNDPNKTIKMAQKSAFVDAVIRSSGLSDFYTQDLEDMNPGDIAANHGGQSASQQQSGAIKPSQKQIELIQKLAREKEVGKEDLVAAGFTGKLTGGKDGIASKLIEYLMKLPNKPKESETNQENTGSYGGLTEEEIDAIPF